MDSEHLLDLTDKEMIVLLGLMKAQEVIGIPNPFAGLSDEDIKAESEKVMLNLKDRNLVGKEDDGDFWIDEIMTTALSVIAYSNMRIQVDTPDEKPSTSIFYFADDFVIECEEMDDHTYRIWQRAEPKQTIEDEIFLRVGYEHKPVSKSGTLILPGLFVNDWIARNIRLNDLDMTIQMLNDDENSHVLWRHLKRSLNRKSRMKRMMMYYFAEDEWKVEGIFTVFSPSNNWVLRMIDRDGEEFLQAKQVDLIGLSREYVAVLERCLKDHEHTILQ